jgi:hypothetical protein
MFHPQTVASATNGKTYFLFEMRHTDKDVGNELEYYAEKLLFCLFGHKEHKP